MTRAAHPIPPSRSGDAAAPVPGEQGRRLSRLEVRGAGDADERFVASLSSEEPYRRWWGTEVLDHSQDAIDLSRARDGLPLLFGHDAWSPATLIGRIENLRIENRRLRGDLRFFSTEDAQRVATMVREGHREMSIGYHIDELVLESRTDDEERYRVTRWTLLEGSIVSVPADHTVGVGRSRNHPQRTAPVGASPLESTMEPDENNPAGPNTDAGRGTAATAGAQASPAAPQAGTQTRGAAAPAAPAAPADATVRAVQLERDRSSQIRASAERFGVRDLGEEAVRDGTPLEVWRERLLERLQSRGALRPAESPEIGMSAREVARFSFRRALLAASDPAVAQQVAPFEMECSRAAQQRRGDSRSTEREAAITIPVDVLNSGISLGEEAARRAAGLLIQRAQRTAVYRDLVVGTPTAGGNLVPTELLASDFITLLRNAMVLDRMGVRWMRDLNGNIAIPRQTGAGTGYWVAENTSPTESQQTVDQVTMSPKTVGAFTDYSRRLLLQSSIDIEAFVRADLAAIVGLAIQLAAINGSGASNQPLGVLNTSGIGAVAGGTNGAAPTYDLMVDLETAVANANADVGTLAYLTNSRVRGKLRKTQVFSGTNGAPVWTSGRERGVGELLGYDAFVSNAVPNTLDKGSATGVCSAVVFGDWSQLMIGMWGGLDLMLDPYTGATAGTRRVIALQDVDVAVRNPVFFAAMKDALTT